MPTVTVFELSEADEPLARRQLIHQAFALICEKARFKPTWTREGFITTLEFSDLKGAREIEARRKSDPDADKARRELMMEAMGEGIWGYHGVPDLEYQREHDKAEAVERAQRATLARALSEDVVDINVIRDGGMPRARFDGEAVWNVGGDRK